MRFFTATILAGTIIILPSTGHGQADAKPPATGFSKAIEDNSFLIEEAYNQEPGVIQHISNAILVDEDIAFTFTEEWPFLTQTHQVSLTIPYFSMRNSLRSGVGDVQVNYRYQILSDNAHLAAAPRLTVILPTGKISKGIGTGRVGWQFNLPLSLRLSDPFITHVNAGVTVTPNVKGVDHSVPDGLRVERTLTTFTAGASFIWLATPSLNLMAEFVVNAAGGIDYGGDVVHETSSILNPGLRYAIDIGSLQIVPGFSIPVTMTEEETTTGMLFYLSFEHPL
jgi:hypothetical protein